MFLMDCPIKEKWVLSPLPDRNASSVRNGGDYKDFNPRKRFWSRRTRPSLGFLRLPEKYLGWLRAINSFYNLTKSRDEYLANSTPGPDSVDAIVGMIHERTK